MVRTADDEQSSTRHRNERRAAGEAGRREAWVGPSRLPLALSPNVHFWSRRHIVWSGQFEYLQRATQKLKLVVPFTLVIIFVLLYLAFRNFASAAFDRGYAAVRAHRRLVAAILPRR